MPRLPTYDGPSVQSGQLDGPRQSSVVSPALLNAGNEGLANIGQGLQRFGSELAQREVEKQKVRDMDMVNRAELAYASQEQDFLASLNKRQGINAWGATKDTEAWAKERFAEHSKLLENDTQRKAFEARFGERAMRVRGIAIEWEEKQNKASYLDSRQAQLGQAISEAAADLKQVPQSRAKIDAVIGDLATAQGWDADTIKAERKKFTTSLHEQVIQGLDPSAAPAYFEQHKDEIDGTKWDSIRKGYQAEERVKTTQTQGDFYEGKLRDGSMSLQQALDEIGQKFEGEQEKELKLELKQRVADSDAAREKGQRAAADQAWKIFESTRRLSAIPPKLREQMDGKDYLALESEARRLAESGTKEPKLPPTDWDVYSALRQKAINGQLEISEIRTFFPKLGKAEREGLIDLASKKDKPEVLHEVSTLDSQLSAQVERSGIGNDQNEQFKAAVRNEIDARFKGKPTTAAERQKVIDEMIIEQRIPGAVFGDSWPSKKPTWQLTPEDKSKIMVDPKTGKPVSGKPAPKANPNFKFAL